MDEKKDGVELLREYAEGKKEKRFCPILHGHYGDVDGDCMRGTCAECEGGYLAALADRIGREREELDKRLMPEGMEWPRWSDGEPIADGDAPEGAEWVVLGLKGIVYALLHDLPSADCVEIGMPSTPIERPKPAVLAADGLPIREGETVWYDGAEYVVDRVYTASDGDCSVDLEFGDLRSATNVWPQLIDHTPPDTQERIDGDATMPPRAYYAKHIGHDVGLKDDAECTEAMVRHLLRRQRGLDKRMMGGAE